MQLEILLLQSEKIIFQICNCSNETGVFKMSYWQCWLKSTK